MPTNETPRSRDHQFTDLQRSQYDSLKAQGRDYYDDLRWNRNYTHNDAFIAARYSYGTNTKSKDALADAYRADIARTDPNLSASFLDAKRNEYRKLI